MSDKINVLVVDDSSLVRKIITDILESDPRINVIGSANNGKTAIYRNNELEPDVITLDIEMPILDGLSALEEIMKTNPKPVIMLSVLTKHGADATFRALDLGAVDFVPKPSSVLSLTMDEIGELLISKVKSVCNIKFRKPENKRIEPVSPVRNRQVESSPVKISDRVFTPGDESSKIVGIGTSTGGPAALLKLFKGFPDNFPSPLLIVQHMPEGFTKAFAERLNDSSKLKVKEAEDNDKVLPGHALVAPGHSHIILEGKPGKYRVRLDGGDKKSGHRPSIDMLFESLADRSGGETVGVIMTGMGRDGAEGTKKIRNRGGYTIAQDEETSVVFGMNRVAVEMGGVMEVVPLHEITKKIVEHV
jgi:two-component system chemotaxis response regulator CheB